MALPGMSSETVHKLLNPVDKQNVPKAVNLVQSLVKLRMLPASINPTEIHRRHTLIFLARVLDHFVLPFNSIEMTLSQQVRSLSAYAHLTAAMYLKHGLAFLTGALYADSQAIVKNIIFCIARLQLIDGNLKFYIILEGTDRLETIFSDVCTQDHSRNFDVLQLSQKLSVSAAISATFKRHPNLDRGHRKLALKDAKGVDHVNPKSWRGDVRVGQVELSAEWINGQNDANILLKEYFGSEERVDFAALWLQPGKDLLQPVRSGAYIGSQWSHDDERSERTEDIAELDGPENDGDDEFDDLPVGMGIKDFLDSEAASDEPRSTHSFDNFLVVDNKKFMKASIVTVWLSSKRARKLTVRTLRARGVTLEDLRRPSDNWNSTDLIEGDVVKTGDLAACLVRAGETITLAIIEIISFEYTDSRRQVTSITVDEMEDSGTGDQSKVTVHAQIMDMEQTNDSQWNWTRRYMRFEMGKGKGRNTSSDKSTQRNFILHIPAMLVYPVGSSIVSLNPSSQSAKSSDTALTWSLAQADLTEILDFAWSELNPDSEEIIGNIELTPSLPDSMLPYRDRNSEFLLLTCKNTTTLNHGI